MSRLKLPGKNKQQGNFTEIDERNEKMPFRAKDWWK